MPLTFFRRSNVQNNNNKNTPATTAASSSKDKRRMRLKKVDTFDEVIICKKVLRPNQVRRSSWSLSKQSSTSSLNADKTDIVLDSALKKQRFLYGSLRSLYSNDDQDEEKPVSELTCCICLEKYEGGDEIGWSRNPKCKHVFHKECIIEWLRKQENCPMCRKPFYKRIIEKQRSEPILNSS